MNNYKFIVPIVLVAVLLLSMYMLYDTRSTQKDQYDTYLAEAKKYVEEGIAVDAETNYLLAYELKPTVGLSMEIANMYKHFGQQRKATDWGFAAMEEYPKETGPYEFLVEYYYELNDYEACYEVADEYRGRKLQSAKIDGIIKELKYAFYYIDGFDEAGIFSAGYAAFLDDGKWGYVNTRGEKVVGREFAKAGAFSSAGLAPVVDLEGEAYFIDAEGNKKHTVKAESKVVELGYISDDIFPVYNGRTWAFYNYENKKLSEDYQDASAIGNGLAAVMYDDMWHIVDANWKPVIDQSYVGVVMDDKTIVYRNDRLFVESLDGYHMIDAAGKTYGETYDEARLFSDDTYAAVRKGEKWGFVDATGKMVIEPQFQDARSFCNGLAAVELDNRWGYIDLTGNMVIKPEFEGAKDFTSNGVTFVVRRNGSELIQLLKDKYNYPIP